MASPKSHKNPPRRKPQTASQKKAAAAHRKKVGQRIKARIKELGLTYREVGKNMETSYGNPVSESQVGQWANGEVLPEASRQEDLARALLTDWHDLSGEREDSTLARRLELVEEQVQAILRIEGLEEAVNTWLRRQRVRGGDRRDVLEQIAQGAPIPNDAPVAEDETGRVPGAARRPR